MGYKVSVGTRLKGWTRLLVALASLAVMLAPGVVRADNLGGVFAVCAQLTRFEEPAGESLGEFVLVGIGPGLYNEPGDDSHHFSFSYSFSIDAETIARLHALAAARAFTCLRIDANGRGPDEALGGTYVKSVIVLPKTDVCGQILENRDGTFTVATVSLHMQLIANADDYVRNHPRLLALFDQLKKGPEMCVHFETGASGVANRVELDGKASFCARLAPGTDPRVGSVAIPSKVIGDVAADALRLLAGDATRACASIELAATRVTDAEVTAAGRMCGYVTTGTDGSISIDGRAIPGRLLRPDQRDALARTQRAGLAPCLEIDVKENIVRTELTGLAAAPTPAPTSAASSPTPVTSVGTLTPSPPASVMVAIASGVGASSRAVDLAGNPVAGGGADLGTLLALVLLIGLLVALGVANWIRIRQGRAVHAGAMTAASAPTNAGIGGPPLVDRGQAQPTPGPALRSSQIVLTAREREVLTMVVDGMTNRQIGEALFISESTAGVHVSNIMGKLGAANRTEAAAISHRLGLLQFDRVGPPTDLH